MGLKLSDFSILFLSSPTILLSQRGSWSHLWTHGLGINISTKHSYAVPLILNRGNLLCKREYYLPSGTPVRFVNVFLESSDDIQRSLWKWSERAFKTASEATISADRAAFNACAPLHDKIFIDLKAKDFQYLFDTTDKNHPTMRKWKFSFQKCTSMPWSMITYRRITVNILTYLSTRIRTQISMTGRSLPKKK